MEKGARVTITAGRNGLGESGTVFWKGPNNWGEGERLGVRGDNGETYWVADTNVEPASGPAPIAEPGPTFEKGDRVSFEQRGQPGTGTVFWIGESKQGPGQRLGVRNDDPDGDDDAVWLDARFCKPHVDGEAPAAAPTTNAPEADGAPPAPPDERWQAPQGADDLPQGPPIDDASADQWATALPDDDDDDGIPADWQPGE